MHNEISLKEKLALASLVEKNGPTWVNISRMIKQFLDPGRPSEWLNPVHCAQQYNLLSKLFDNASQLHKTNEEDISKEKEIVKILTDKRQEELMTLIEEETNHYLKLKQEIYLLENNQLDYKQMQDMLQEMGLQDKQLKGGIISRGNTFSAGGLDIISPHYSPQKAVTNIAISTISPTNLTAKSTSIIESTLKREVVGSSPIKVVSAPMKDMIVNTTAEELLEEDDEDIGMNENILNALNKVEQEFVERETVGKQQIGTPPQTQVPANNASSLADTIITDGIVTASVGDTDTTIKASPQSTISPIKASPVATIGDHVDNTYSSNSFSSPKQPSTPAKAAPQIMSPIIKSELIMNDQKTFVNIASTSNIIHKNEDIIGVPLLKDNKRGRRKKLKLEPPSMFEFEETSIAPIEPAPVKVGILDGIGTTNSTPSPVPYTIKDDNNHGKIATINITQIPISANASIISSTIKTEEDETTSLDESENISLAEMKSDAGSEILPNVGTARRALLYTSNLNVSSGPKSEAEKLLINRIKTSVPGFKLDLVTLRRNPKIIPGRKLSVTEQLPGNAKRVLATTPENTIPPKPLALDVHRLQPGTPEHKIWKRSIMLLHGRLCSHNWSDNFFHPITDAIAPFYSSIIHYPVDLGSLKKWVENGTVRSTNEYRRWVQVMFQNALMYNSEDHLIYKMTQETYTDALKNIQEYLVAASSPTNIPIMSLADLRKTTTTPSGLMLPPATPPGTPRSTGTSSSIKDSDSRPNTPSTTSTRHSRQGTRAA